MKYEIEFTREDAAIKFAEITRCFECAEETLREENLPGNIKSVCEYKAAVNSMKVFGARASAASYNENGYSRIVYGQINGHEFVLNCEFRPNVLKIALEEIADGRRG